MGGCNSVCAWAPLCLLPRSVDWCDAENEEGAQKDMSLERTHAHPGVRAHVSTHTALAEE